jgi:hypothetical protein
MPQHVRMYREFHLGPSPDPTEVSSVPVAGLIRLGKMLKFAIAVCHSRGWRHYSVLIAGRFRSGCLPAVSTPSRDLAGKSPPLLARLNRS